MRPSQKFRKQSENNHINIDENFVFLSKTVLLENDENVPGLDVETHCRISGYVASKIISTFPDAVRKLLFVESTPLLAAVHDTGKINPDFQKMIYGCVSKTSAKCKF